ncbi:CAP domain-containing protein [Aliiroseovarius subalbicans]|uniref:CAP domain-containing protein n=1 Tax=Aliiroseovarius subalbicans TaxID=2925840 RepID=UPI001F59B64C|nr:CAP domain-containing protein [Aliiroseovarius subalbicans]MCI2400798.1 CAP domain-containing protein [Aliiroseovarius subalbicans]
MYKQAFAAIFAGFFLIIAAADAAQAAGCAQPTEAATLMAEAGNEMNAVRGTQGRHALARSARLDAIAQAHACWMAQTGTFSHIGNGRSKPMRRAKRGGYCTRFIAENIAMGQRSGGAVVETWMASDGHRRNILLGKTREYGVGLSILGGKPAWVMVYAKPC